MIVRRNTGVISGLIKESSEQSVTVNKACLVPTTMTTIAFSLPLSRT